MRRRMTMKAILSTTMDDIYLFSLPFAVYSWSLVGAGSVIFRTKPKTVHEENKRILVFRTIEKVAKGVASIHHYIDAPNGAEATYMQCSRLFASADLYTFIDEDEILITADADMCVFDRGFWEMPLRDNEIQVIGDDLVDAGQLPMCYIKGRKKDWAKFMHVYGKTPQQCLDELLGGITVENMRGNYWCKDQETAYEHMILWPGRKSGMKRTAGSPFATRRADRDGWPEIIPGDILDAHLPRPGWTEENFSKIANLFYTLYPKLDIGWMFDYVEQYRKLLWQENLFTDKK
jgi:hypothetical protein